MAAVPKPHTAALFSVLTAVLIVAVAI